MKKKICTKCKKMVDVSSHICVPIHKSIKPKGKAKTYEQKQRMSDDMQIHYKFYSSNKWRSKRLNVLKDSLYQCQCCMLAEANHVHHIVYTSTRDGWENRLSTDNLIAVCSHCHSMIHKHKASDDHKLREFIAKYRIHLNNKK